MTVKELRKVLKDVPDKTEVVLTSYDHSYQSIDDARQEGAEEYAGGGDYGECLDESDMMLDGSKFVEVLVLT